MSKRERLLFSIWVGVVSATLIYIFLYPLPTLYDRTDFLLQTHNNHLFNEHGVRPEVEIELDVQDTSNNDLLRVSNH